MTTEVLSPAPWQKFWDNNGAPAVGYQLFTYAAGTSTKLVTYKDSAGTQNSNPVLLDSRGECNLWLTPNVGYKYVLAYPTDTDPPTNPIKTTDNITVSQLLTLYGGIDTGAANAYLLNFVATFTTYQNGTVIYWVPSNNNSGASTINVNGIGVVNIVNPDGTALGANQILANRMTEIVYYNGAFQLVSLGNFTGSTIGTFGTETAIASAATTDLGSATAHVVLITGTTTITSFGSSASLSAPIYIVRFSGALTLTYNATTLIIPGNASIVTTPGDAAIVEYLGAGAWKVLFYQYSAGAANAKIKPADTVRSSNTLTADPDLLSNTLAIGRYAFEIYLVFDATVAATGFQWTNGGTAVDARGLMPALVSGWVNGASYGPKSETPYGATITYATINTSADGNQVLYKGSLLVGTVGTFGVNWAPVAAATCTLRAGSYLTTTLLNTGSANTGLTHTYSTAGSGTETIPTGYTTLTLEVWGGGGGGNTGVFVSGNGSGGGGGQAGGYSRSVISVAGLGGDTVPYTVGAAGSVGFPGTASTAGGGTLPMTAMTANGGANGSAAANQATPGAGGSSAGTATGGTAVNTTGFSGGSGTTENTGVGGGGTAGGSVAGIYGSGGSGGRGQGAITAATAGAAGLIIFTYA
jgi:hypothetical protein